MPDTTSKPKPQSSDAKASTKPKHAPTSTPEPSTDTEGSTVEVCEVCTAFIHRENAGRCPRCGHTPNATSAPQPDEQVKGAISTTTPAKGDSEPHDTAGAASEG